MERPPSPATRRRSGVLGRLLADRRGGSAIEYGLILAFIVLMMFGALVQMAGITKDMWSDISTRVTTAR